MMNTDFLPNQGRFGSTTVDNNSSKNLPEYHANYSHNTNTMKGNKDFDMNTDFYSPRTITLGNQSANIVRGMTAEQLQLGSTQYHQQLQQQNLQQGMQQRPPYLPSMRISPTASSRPIRITRRKPAYLNPYPKANENLKNLKPSLAAVTGQQPPNVVAATEDFDEHLSASPRELKLFYDERTWHMYHLIQTSRLEKEESEDPEDDDAAMVSDDGHDYQFQQLQQHHPLPQDDGMDYLRKDTFLKTAATLTAAPPMSTMRAPLQSPMNLAEVDHYQIDFEEDQEPEGVFELDDL